MQQVIVVDTNILFSALLSSNSRFRELLLKSEERFFICEFVVVEIFKRKEKIIRASKLTEDEIVEAYHLLLKRIELYKEDSIASENRNSAYALCSDIDENDTPHIALTLELNGLLWTGDKKLKEGLKQKGFDSFFEPNW